MEELLDTSAEGLMIHFIQFDDFFRREIMLTNGTRTNVKGI
jgi:hypothetical protein